MGVGSGAGREQCLLVEDQASTSKWLVEMLERAFPRMDVTLVDSVRSARQWLRQPGEPRNLTLALVDIGLPDGSGVELVGEIAERFPDAMAVVATIYDDDAHLFDAIAAGARGYLLKDADPDILIGYLRRIENGEPPLSPSIAHRMMEHFRGQPRTPASKESRNISDLTAREVEVLALMARGLTVREAAGRLGLTENTVAGYIKTIYQKLNISNRAEAALEAARRNLV